MRKQQIKSRTSSKKPKNAPITIPPITPGASPSFSWWGYIVTTPAGGVVDVVMTTIGGGLLLVVHAHGVRVVIVSKVVLELAQVVAVTVGAGIGSRG